MPWRRPAGQSPKIQAHLPRLHTVQRTKKSKIENRKSKIEMTGPRIDTTRGVLAPSHATSLPTFRSNGACSYRENLRRRWYQEIGCMWRPRTSTHCTLLAREMVDDCGIILLPVGSIRRRPFTASSFSSARLTAASIACGLRMENLSGASGRRHAIERSSLSVSWNLPGAYTGAS